jgi:hypothetical protein
MFERSSGQQVSPEYYYLFHQRFSAKYSKEISDCCGRYQLNSLHGSGVLGSNQMQRKSEADEPLALFCQQNAEGFHH